MARTFGYIIPWILVSVLGFLALYILFMRRARFEGFVTAPAAPQMTVDEHIITSLTDMTTKITKLQNDLQNAVVDISGVKTTVCTINKSIQDDYILSRTPSAGETELAAAPKKQLVYAKNRTEKGVQAWQLAQTTYLFRNRRQLLDCTVPKDDISGADISGADISGADSEDISGAAVKETSPVEGFFVPPDPNQITTLLTHLQESLDMFTTYSETQDVQSWFDTIGKIPNTEQFLSNLMDIAIKKYDVEETESEGFKDVSKTVKVYTNATYTYPVPFKDSQINKTQASIYRTISAAYDVYTNFIQKVGTQYQEAKYAASILAIKYAKYQSIKSKFPKQAPAFDT